jgi:hypothetical protein
MTMMKCRKISMSLIFHMQKSCSFLSFTHLTETPRVCAVHKPLYYFSSFNYISPRFMEEENYVCALFTFYIISRKIFLSLHTHLIFFSRFHYMYLKCVYIIFTFAAPSCRLYLFQAESSSLIFFKALIYKDTNRWRRLH